MAAALLGKKIGMTRVYTEAGVSVPVTVIQAGPCPVLQVKTADGPDGYMRLIPMVRRVRPIPVSSLNASVNQSEMIRNTGKLLHGPSSDGTAAPRSDDSISFRNNADGSAFIRLRFRQSQRVHQTSIIEITGVSASQSRQQLRVLVSFGNVIRDRDNR